MKFLEDVAEIVAGVAIGAVSLLVLVVGGLFAFGSLGKYLRAKSM